MRFDSLNRHQRIAYQQALVSDHYMRVHLRIHNKNEKVIGSFTSNKHNRFISGAVQIKSNSSITRTLDLTLIDPERKLHFDNVSPSPHAMFPDKWISVLYGVWVHSMNEWVDDFVFWGPMTSFSREANEVQLSAQDPAVLMLAPQYVHAPYTIKENTKVVDAIKQVARRMGCRRFALPDLKQRINAPHAVHRGAEAWRIITARGHNVQGFTAHVRTSGKQANKNHPKAWIPSGGLMAHLPDAYEAMFTPDGYLTIRKRHKHHRFVFKEGVHLVSQPDITYNMDQMINTVRVNGVPKKNSKKIPHAEVSVRPKNRLSPQRLAWNGVPRYMMKFIHAPNLHSFAECHHRAKKELFAHMISSVDVTFDSLPIPFLKEHDHVTLNPLHGPSLKFGMVDWTLPLTSDSPMTVGAHHKHHQHKRKHHRHHHHHHHHTGHHHHHHHGHHHGGHHHGHHHGGGGHHHHHRHHHGGGGSGGTSY